MIYILVPTYARVEETKKFLGSIQDSIKQEYLVLVIDDHPDKITYKSIEQNEQIKVFPSEREIWWVGSINFGIQTLFEKYNLEDDDIVVFANNDVQIDKDSFELLHDEIKKDKNQIVHPRTFDQDDVEASSGTKILSLFPYITNHPKNFQEEKKTYRYGDG